MLGNKGTAVRLPVHNLSESGGEERSHHPSPRCGQEASTGAEDGKDRVGDGHQGELLFPLDEGVVPTGDHDGHRSYGARGWISLRSSSKG